MKKLIDHLASLMEDNKAVVADTRTLKRMVKELNTHGEVLLRVRDALEEMGEDLDTLERDAAFLDVRGLVAQARDLLETASGHSDKMAQAMTAARSRLTTVTQVVED